MKYRAGRLLIMLLFLSPALAGLGSAIGLDQVAEAYVKLVLAVGEHDRDYVDAYYGPPEWQQQAKQDHAGLSELADRAATITKDLEAAGRAQFKDLEQPRYDFLSKQLRSVVARISILKGKKLTFDEESEELYDAVAPRSPESNYNAILEKVERLLPGRGPLPDRFEAFQRQFIIPKEKLVDVFSSAIEECRKRTKRHIELPGKEKFTVEYVTGKPWSGYNWYKGNATSVIQVNTDLPILWRG